MKILKLEIQNILGIERAEILCGQPITLIAGGNEAGKSSLMDSVSMALNGQPRRVKLKKDMQQLVHDKNGAKKGRVTLVGAGLDGEEVLGQFTLPKGEHQLGSSLEKAPGYEFLPLLLDAEAFIRLNADERRKTLFRLTNCSAKPDYILAELSKAGCDEKLAQQIIGMARSGFPAMHEEAKKRKSEARGVWQQTTGETWGSEKAEGWAVEIPSGKPVSHDDLDKAIAEQHKIQNQIEDGVAFRARLLADIEAQINYDSVTSDLADKAALLERAKKKREVTAEDLDKQITQRNKLNAQLGTAPACACPHCGGAVLVVNGELKDGNASLSAAERKKAQAELAKVVDAIAMLERTHANDDQAVRTAELAAQQLEQHLARQPAEIPADKLEKTDAALLERRQALAAAEAKRNALQERFDLLNSAAKTNEIATAKHAEIKAWEAIEQQMAPSGIPAKLLSKALTPFNDALAILARLSGFGTVVISSDMDVTYAGRAYGLCSESAQWRCNAMLVLVIAQLSGLKFAMLDRLDVLEVKARPKLAAMVMKLTELGNLDSLILCGTMKEKPAMPPAFQTLWIENGVVLSEGID